MTTTSENTTLASDAGALKTLRALAAGPPGSIADALDAANKQAELLRNLLPSSPGHVLGHLTSLIPNILIEYVDAMPVPGISFWGNADWHIHIRASDPVDVQQFTALHELKHIIDHPLRRQQPNLLTDGDWEALADRFAARVLAQERDRPRAEEKGGTSTNQPSTSRTAGMTTGGASLLLTIPEACDALRISRWALYQLINKRRLKTVRIDRRRLIAPADLTALVEELRQEGDDDGK